jgi:hypothetical protein
MAQGFPLPFQLLTPVVIMNGAGALRGDAGASIIDIVQGDLIVRMHLVCVKAGLACCLVLRSL